MVRSPTCTAVSASISTPVRAVHSTVARHSIALAARSIENSTATEVSGTGWHSGTSSEVRLAAWIAATRATPSTSPFFAPPDSTRASVAGSMRIRPPAIATRWVSALPATSTMRAAPRSSKWVSFSVIMAIHKPVKPSGHRPMVAARPRPSRRVKFRALIAAFLIAFQAGFACAQGLPDLGDVSSTSLSDQQETVIGNRVMRDVRADPDYIDDPEISDYINSLGQRLVAAADGPHRDFDFFVVRDDAINAFALPGGHVGVYSTLVLLTDNESELAGVVGHEIGHILQHHAARSIYGQRGATLASLAALALAIAASRAGDQGAQVTEAAVASAGAMQMQNQLNYTREHEREADRVGLTLMDHAGFAPRAMVTFFQRLLRSNRLNELKGAPSYLRDHPLTTERIADMEDRVQNLPSRLVGDTFEYRIVKAKLRVMMA